MPAGEKRRADEAVLPGVTKRAKAEDDTDADGDVVMAPHETSEEKAERFERTWRRPEAPPLNTATDDIIFQQTDVDYAMGRPLRGMPGSMVGPVPIMRMFGVTENGNSVLALVHGVSPYFYIEAPPKFQECHCQELRTNLNEAMSRLPAHGVPSYKDNVLHVGIVHKQSIMGFHGSAKRPFLRITVAAPMLVPSARKLLEKGNVMIPTFARAEMQTYESNIQFALRFMIDYKIVGASWIKCPAGKYQVVPDQEKISRCQYEITFSCEEFISLGAEGEWGKIAPLRILSFDIECSAQERGRFPEPEKDPVIQIGNILSVHGQSEPVFKNIFSLGGCSNIVGSQVLTFKNERDLLIHWSEFMQIVDPDIVTGYNICNFDFWFLVKRAEQLRADQFTYLGRIKSAQSKVKDTVFSSKAYGRRESKSIVMFGRVQLDMLQVMQRDQKLRSYSLNAVSAHFLGQQKEDVHFTIISDLFHGSDDDRRRLAVYCIKDSYLPILLMEKLMVLVNYLEMARVTGVPVSYLLTRGQQVKVLSQLYRKAAQKEMLIPTVESQGGQDNGEVAYEGATVFKPITGFHEKPVSTLDFSSLYPSIMMAHNLCYTTLLDPANVASMPADSYTRSPTGDFFVKKTVQEGILPCILDELLTARKAAKRALAAEKDTFKAAVLNGRQLALKVSANSVYGFTGALRGKLPCLAISQSVTSFGRDMIDNTKRLVEERYCIKNGYSHDAVVIYGDTDSVMVKFGPDDVAECMRLGKEASEFVTTSFLRPINLEFEKVYYPYLLMSKKRYAGLLWTKPEKYDYLDAKGIVTVRRDNCQLVREVIDTCLNKILIDRDLKGAEEYAKKMISDLLQQKMDLSLLVITKALSKTEYAVKQAHVELAERMRKRDPGSAPNIGDRVPFVIAKVGGKDAKAYEKAEDPLYALEKGIPLDAQYYLDHQLKNPLLSIFSGVMKDPNQLFRGKHTMKVAGGTSKSSPLGAFMKRVARCMNCKAVLQGAGNEDTLCDHCKSLNVEAQIYQERLAKVANLELQFSRAWTQCQSCQGSFHQPVLCTSRDCPIFYVRKKIQKELGDAQKALERFSISDW